MIDLLMRLKEKVVIGFVGGSDLSKQIEQLGANCTTELFDFGFAENGVTAYRLGQLISQEVMRIKETCTNPDMCRASSSSWASKSTRSSSSLRCTTWQTLRSL